MENQFLSIFVIFILTVITLECETKIIPILANTSSDQIQNHEYFVEFFCEVQSTIFVYLCISYVQKRCWYIINAICNSVESNKLSKLKCKFCLETTEKNDSYCIGPFVRQSPGSLKTLVCLKRRDACQQAQPAKPVSMAARLCHVLLGRNICWGSSSHPPPAILQASISTSVTITI